jgi:hypothetical protein
MNRKAPLEVPVEGLGRVVDRAARPGEVERHRDAPDHGYEVDRQPEPAQGEVAPSLGSLVAQRPLRRAISIGTVTSRYAM